MDAIADGYDAVALPNAVALTADQSHRDLGREAPDAVIDYEPLHTHNLPSEPRHEEAHEHCYRRRECLSRDLGERVVGGRIGAASFEPLPFGWTEPLKVRAHPDFVLVLRRLRDWTAASPSSWRRREMGGRLFSAVAREFDGTVLAVLEEAVRTGDEPHVSSVAALLRHASRELVFGRADFVCQVLIAASRLGDKMVQQVAGSLHGAVASGGRSGSPGLPFPEDVDQRSRARAIAETLPRGSVEEKFFRSLERSADAAIRWKLDDDERVFDRREW